MKRRLLGGVSAEAKLIGFKSRCMLCRGHRQGSGQMIVSKVERREPSLVDGGLCAVRHVHTTTKLLPISLQAVQVRSGQIRAERRGETVYRVPVVPR